MQHRFWKSLLTFFLVLVLTIAAVAALSMVTAAKTETAPIRYSQQVRENQAEPATELSAVVPEEPSSSFANVAAFLLVISVSFLAVFFTYRSFRKSQAAPKRSYSPEADRTFQNAGSVRRVSVKRV